MWPHAKLGKLLAGKTAETFAFSGACVGISSGTLPSSTPRMQSLVKLVALPGLVITSRGPPNMDTEHPRPLGTLPTRRFPRPCLTLCA